MAEALFHNQPTLPSSSTRIPTLPRQIGPYPIDSQLSQGGMSLLYLGTHPDTRVPLAIKVLAPAFLNEPDAIQRFLKEAQMITLADHPHIVKLYGHGEWEHGLYIAMEWVQGISIRHCITQESLSFRKSLEVILQVAYALAHLHHHGIIHRDLKPENILMTEDGNIKVIDFGIAQLHHERSSLVMGTPSYMSPEQKDDPKQISFASDLYALGVILYELITQKLSHGLIDLAVLPKKLKQIIGKAVAVSPSERYTEVSLLIHDITDYLSSSDIDLEKPHTDQVKELHEILQATSQQFSPSQTPAWSSVDLGLAKTSSFLRLGLYYDFFRFPDNAYLILMAASALESVDSLAYIGYLRGLIHMALKELPSSNLWSATSFAETLNTLLCHQHQPFGLNLLLLNPLQNQLTYLTCGFNALIHLPQGAQYPRILSAPNPPLGIDPSASFAQIQDNWEEGDTLLLHTLEQDPPLDPEFFARTLHECALFSPKKQADQVFKTAQAVFPSLRFPRLVLSIQRLL